MQIGSPRASGIGINIGSMGMGLLRGSFDAGPTMLMKNKPAIGAPKNSSRTPENSITVASNGFISLFPPFLTTTYFMTIYKLNKVFLINTKLVIVIKSVECFQYRQSGTIVI
jgi:hypothetical protein